MIYFQAPAVLQEFFSSHKFAQRLLPDGSNQQVNFTHQPLDMLHEEIIRLQLICLDKNRLRKNAETGRMERDSEVFTQASRFLGFMGEDFAHNSVMDRSMRKYDRYYKQVLLIRRQLRKAGFLADYQNAGLAFYSIDMKCEMHPDLHNFKHIGEENFLKALNDLACGKKYTSLSCAPQPKTIAEEVKISKRHELSKEELHRQAKEKIRLALLEKHDDLFLISSLEELSSRKANSFKLKQDLLDFVLRVDQYIDGLKLEKNIKEVLIDEDDDDDDVGC